MFYGQTSPNLTFLLEITDTVSSGLKRRETVQHVISIQFKSQHLWWYGVHKCIWYGQIACFGRHYECRKVYKGFRATYFPLQTTSISEKALCISAWQFKTTYCSYYSSMALTRSFTYREHLAHHLMKNTSKTTTNSSAAGNLYQARMGPNTPNTKTPETHNLNAQMSSNCFEKKRRCHTMVNIVKTFFPVTLIQKVKLAYILDLLHVK